VGAKIAQPFTAGTKKKLASGKIAQPFTYSPAVYGWGDCDCIDPSTPT